ncbi:MAG: sulfotransferase domain-containing protein [Deltaproteobacteria bacterium]|nr:sulfotransferase domain-containing protein [Deltaproteobacteria bacterium]
MDRAEIVVVSGLPRSGTSMMMRMLEAGGIEPLSDGLRSADDDNPLGYYEFERVKGLPGDTAWLAEAEGRAVKVVSALLEQLPRDHRYKVVFLQRDLGEVLASQRRMLERRGREVDAGGEARLAALFDKHLTVARERLAARDEIEVEFIRYDEVIADPRGAARRLALFLGRAFDEAAAARAVDPALYRQRAG